MSQIPSVHELTRLLAAENLLWCTAVEVSQQALAKRFLSFPAELFERIVLDLLPTLHQRQAQRTRRPLPPAIVHAKKHFPSIWMADGSTLEALFRKLDSLKEQPPGQLAGKICTLLDMSSPQGTNCVSPSACSHLV